MMINYLIFIRVDRNIFFNLFVKIDMNVNVIWIMFFVYFVKWKFEKYL